jgi:hypothetical protein
MYSVGLRAGFCPCGLDIVGTAVPIRTLILLQDGSMMKIGLRTTTRHSRGPNSHTSAMSGMRLSAGEVILPSEVVFRVDSHRDCSISWLCALFVLHDHM